MKTRLNARLFACNFVALDRERRRIDLVVCPHRGEPIKAPGDELALLAEPSTLGSRGITKFLGRGADGLSDRRSYRRRERDACEVRHDLPLQFILADVGLRAAIRRSLLAAPIIRVLVTVPLVPLHLRSHECAAHASNESAIGEPVNLRTRQGAEVMPPEVPSDLLVLRHSNHSVMISKVASPAELDNSRIEGVAHELVQPALPERLTASRTSIRGLETKPVARRLKNFNHRHALKPQLKEASNSVEPFRVGH